MPAKEITDLNSAEERFSDQLANDFLNIKGPDDVDRFFAVRFMALLGLPVLMTLDALDVDTHQQMLGRLHRLFHQSFNTITSELMDPSPNSAFAEYRAPETKQ